LFATACTDSDATGGMAAVVRDSAGIEIVEHSAELIAALPEWGLVGEPLVDIGSGSDPAEEFTSVLGVVRLTDGRIVVHENRASELRLFNAEGRFVRLMARAGEGPGEIRGGGVPQWLEGDTLAITDQQRRTGFFSPEGDFVRQVTHPRMELEGAYLEVISVQKEGHLLAVIQPRMNAPASLGEPTVRRPAPVVRVSLDGAVIDTVANLPGPPFYPVMGSEGGTTFPTWTFAIFSERSHIAMNQDLVVIGTNERNEIHIYRGPSLHRLIRNATPANPVTEAEVTRYKAPTLARLANQNIPEVYKQERREALERQRVASHFPFHDWITIARDGSLWVQDYRPVSTDPYRFTVYGANGKAVARVVLPERVRPWQMDLESVVGVWLDADDVPHVRVWRIGPARS